MYAIEVIISIDCCIYVLCKPYGNHKAKAYRRFTKDREVNQCISLWKIVNLQMKEAREETGNTKQPENIKIALINPYLSIIMTNKRHRPAG